MILPRRIRGTAKNVSSLYYLYSNTNSMQIEKEFLYQTFEETSQGKKRKMTLNIHILSPLKNLGTGWIIKLFQH